MLYIVGLGLTDEKDISVNGLEIVKKADQVYLEAYTAILLVEKEQLVSRTDIPSYSTQSDLTKRSRKHTMDVQSFWPTGRWSSPRAKRS